ncbi:TPA: HNH endonuclease [Vibrio parahaemolyticus]|uniref:HNH endonuclease family protein n=1 Tax=Vibrio parahaemolyticus TaxID=670 RepID=UPI0005B6CA02|nr:HNH endonuclease family protein [Vibrio parahaemolyticus]KIT42297.1 hypothetical protein H320_15900 [Vibrio parahaemolyticus 49]EGQ8734482.1 DUF1524 domain-containing protein [Vibrio parahaemolyticus]EGQ8886261.1 DUF1524 domain-containing protein [Vibrio parahaemolyticus]EGQ8917076.1 DUF1524 domain-containing protein [Vibrio parahaemolyticus]EGQ8936823.1 DUF1524 domain-containing protein [Vibrio parahaemolyticus]
MQFINKARVFISVLLLPRSIITAVLLAVPFSSLSQVKLSNSGICHDEKSPSFDRTKNFKAFDSLESCLESGGRLAKNQKQVMVHKTPDNQPYERSKFGHGWADSDRDCQNSRAEVLIDQSISLAKFKTDKQCLVVSGRWRSLFTGQEIYSASDVDIDHVVPLKWAWEHGAKHWTYEKRISIANDKANLIAVEASLNRQKGAKGIDEWLPPKNQCQYILRFIRIKKKYGIELEPLKEQKYREIQSQYCN